MRPILPAAQAQRELRRGLKEVFMVWVEGRDRDTDLNAGIGFWNGLDTENIFVTDMYTGATAKRTFYHQAILSVGSVRHEIGLSIKSVTIDLSSINLAVQIAFRGYDPNGGKVQVWKRSYDPVTGKAIGIEPYFKGFIDGYPIERPAPGGEASITVTVVSTARSLTATSALKKSAAAQKKRSSSDDFRKYKAVVGDWDIPWGQKGDEE